MYSPTKRCVTILTAVLTCSAAGMLSAQEQPQGVPVEELGKKYQLLGRTGEPLGKVITLQGVVAFGPPTKGYDGGPEIGVQKINGKATQRIIRLPLKAYFGEFGQSRLEGSSLPKLEHGAVYQLEGYETGGYIGIPGEAMQLGGVMLQTYGFGFHEEFVAVKGRKTPAAAFSPGDFVDREALIEGEAINKQDGAYLKGDGWELLVDDRTLWPDWMEHKLAETFGVMRRTNVRTVFRAERSHSRLVKLEDQVGRQVELRGRPWNMNDQWRFAYRGEDIYVENLNRLRGIKLYEPTMIRGVLERAKMPPQNTSDLDQATPKEPSELTDSFIVRRATAETTSELLAPEDPWPKNRRK